MTTTNPDLESAKRKAVEALLRGTGSATDEAPGAATARVAEDASVDGARRTRRKRTRKRARPRHDALKHQHPDDADHASAIDTQAPDIIVDYVPEDVHVPEEYAGLAEAVRRFAGTENGGGDDGDADGDDDSKDTGQHTSAGNEESTAKQSPDTVRVDSTIDGAKQEAHDGENPSAELSARQRRKRTQMSVAQLKALAPRPDAVEQWDITARDPLLLAHLKSLPNSVSVPVNWRHKRKYLQGKRGMEKLPFKLPDYIEETGVSAVRDAESDANAAKTAKQKARERIRPKSTTGVDIDYSVFRDAFFKFQKKPRLSPHGDLYYELRERQVHHEDFRPGVLSENLRTALGMGPDDPPPWLVAMQRYGPPRSYPTLVIPGLNAPIPAGATFGYHRGGWGKPPVDVHGRPLYGDVFGQGLTGDRKDRRFDLTKEEKAMLWGELATSMFDDDDDNDNDVDNTRANEIDAKDATKDTPGEVDESRRDRHDGRSDDSYGQKDDMSKVVPSGLETPTTGIELRKGIAPGALYTVLEEKSASVGRDAMLGSDHTYVIDGGGRTPAPVHGAERVPDEQPPPAPPFGVAKHGDARRRPAHQGQDAGPQTDEEAMTGSRGDAKRRRDFKF